MKCNRLRLEEAMQCSVKAGHRVILVMFDMMHDARLYLAGYYELPCRPNVSPGFLCSRLGKLKSRRQNLRWAMSINSDCANLLTINCVQEPPMPENEVATVSATRECISVEDRAMRVMETNSKAAVRGLFFILPYLWHTSESRNRPITPGRSFPQHQSISWPPENRP